MIYKSKTYPDILHLPIKGFGDTINLVVDNKRVVIPFTDIHIDLGILKSIIPNEPEYVYSYIEDFLMYGDLQPYLSMGQEDKEHLIDIQSQVLKKVRRIPKEIIKKQEVDEYLDDVVCSLSFVNGDIPGLLCSESIDYVDESGVLLKFPWSLNINDQLLNNAVVPFFSLSELFPSIIEIAKPYCVSAGFKDHILLYKNEYLKLLENYIFYSMNFEEAYIDYIATHESSCSNIDFTKILFKHRILYYIGLSIAIYVRATLATKSKFVPLPVAYRYSLDDPYATHIFRTLKKNKFTKKYINDLIKGYRDDI